MCSTLLKITDLIKNKGPITFSFEVTPDINVAEIDNTEMQPMFYSITWHASNHQCKDLNIGPLRLARVLRQKGKEVLLNLTCDFMTKKYLNELIPWLQENGLCNLFIILGSSFDPKRSEFETSQEMISYIREKTSDYFCLGIAGCPYNNHKISNLKEKVENGADFIISQAIFEANIYKDFTGKCKDANIDSPIIPGIFPFDSQKEIYSFLKLCKVEVTEKFNDKLQRESAHLMSITENLICELRNNLHVTHFHFFTMNNLNKTCKLINNIKNKLNEIS